MNNQFYAWNGEAPDPSNKCRSITSSSLQVLRILAWDTVNHLVYYLGTHEKKPGQQHLYVVKDPINEDPRRWV